MKSALALIILPLLGFILVFLVYSAAKRGVIYDKRGHLAARRDVSPLRFWLILSPFVLASLVCFGVFFWMLYSRLVA